MCLLVVVSRLDPGMPLVVGEAMAMEKPVVATDVGGVSELVGDIAALVPARNPEALARAMLNVMQQTSDARRALGCEARARIVTQFNAAIRFPEWEAFYCSLLA